MKPKAAFIAAGALAAMALASPAYAQLSEGGGPVSYSADNLEYFDAERRLVLVGDVDIVQNDARLRADRITLYFSGSGGGGGENQQGLGSGDIERMVAEGEVFYIRPQQDARGDRAVYDVRQDSVTFTGNVIVMSQENVIRGETLVLHIGNRRTVIRPQAGQRVRGVFVPSEDNQQNQGNRGQ
ncbi:MAG: LptA/OstA family protein [Hyphomonadaceae bacterium]